MKGEFYKMDYEAWDEGTIELALDQEAAYLRLCHQMYRRGGPVVNSERLLCSIWRCHPNKARTLLKSLIDAGKIHLTELGHLTNTRVTDELEARETLSKRRADAGRVGGASKARAVHKTADAVHTQPTHALDTSHTQPTHELDVLRNALKSNGEHEAIASTVFKQNEAEERRGEEIRKKPSVVPLFDKLPETSPIGSAEAKRSSRGSRLPSSWVLNPEWRAFASEKGFGTLAIDRMAEKFLNYWISKPGKDAVRLDWFATWRNWVLKELDRHPGTGPPTQQIWPSV